MLSGNGGGTFLMLDDVVAKASRYMNRKVALEGFYIQSFELRILAGGLLENPDGSFAALGSQAWLEWGISPPLETMDGALKKHVNAKFGREDRYGRVRVIGTFRTGGGFGHMGEYRHSITVQEILFQKGGEWITATGISGGNN